MKDPALSFQPETSRVRGSSGDHRAKPRGRRRNLSVFSIIAVILNAILVGVANDPAFASVSEDITPCRSVAVDVWEFSVEEGDLIHITADTTDALTPADLRVFGECDGGLEFFGDDQIECTFTPPRFGCPEVEFSAPADGQCRVHVAKDARYCADAVSVDYELTILTNGQDITPVLVEDDLQEVVVNDTADRSDAAPGNGFCIDETGACTLRAAIEEINAAYVRGSNCQYDERFCSMSQSCDTSVAVGNRSCRLLRVRSLVCEDAVPPTGCDAPVRVVLDPGRYELEHNPDSPATNALAALNTSGVSIEIVGGDPTDPADVLIVGNEITGLISSGPTENPVNVLCDYGECTLALKGLSLANRSAEHAALIVHSLGSSTLQSADVSGNPGNGVLAFGNLDVHDSRVSENAGHGIELGEPTGRTGPGRRPLLNVSSSVISDNGVSGVQTSEFDSTGAEVNINASEISNNAENGVAIAYSKLGVTSSIIRDNGETGLFGCDVRVTESRVSGNALGAGAHDCDVFLTRSLVTDNEVGIAAGDGDTGGHSVLSSTLSGNGVAIDDGGFDRIADSTITDNGVGIARNFDSFDFEVRNSIIAGNSNSAGEPTDCGQPNDQFWEGVQGDWKLAGFNVLGTDCAGALDLTGDEIITDDPGLGELTDNGGPTATHALLPGSPAIDLAPADSCRDEDQRGVARPIGSGCDAGAFESGCGNGIVDDGEDCDDGNTSDSDGCSATCKIELVCGDANGDGALRAGDALLILKNAVGQPVDCPILVCDVNGNGEITASDGLAALRKAVGLPIELQCKRLFTLAFELDTPEPLGALQFSVDYNNVPGELVGLGEEVECSSDVPNVFSVFNNQESRVLEVALVALDGLVPDSIVGQCALVATGDIDAGAISIDVRDAVGLDDTNIQATVTAIIE